jgi:release factor H-coupled RctB family protein
MDGDCVQQFARVARLPGCVAAAGMPDLHAGPVGAVFAFGDRIRPELIGGDAGCGARVAVTTEERISADALERRVATALDDEPLADCAPGALFEAVWQHGPRGLAALDGVPDALAALAAEEPEGFPLGPSGDPGPYRDGFAEQLGSVGGGNHFVEIARVAALHDADAAAAHGLSAGRLVVVAHSGSRGLGYAIAGRWAHGDLAAADITPYLADLAGACRFARANRFVLAYRMLRALSAARASKIAGGFDVTHNDVVEEQVGGAPAWVHRKGAAPARLGQPTIVLGSRGAPSWVMRGTGNAEGLCSVAHGAGRRMARAEAREKLGRRYKRAELGRSKLGGRVLCADPDLLYEEHPDAYKPITPVVESLVEAGLAEPVAELWPVVTVKR